MAMDSVPEPYLDAWARLQVQKPMRVSDADWRQAIDEAGRFLDQRGSLAVEFRWSAGDLFDVPRDNRHMRPRLVKASACGLSGRNTPCFGKASHQSEINGLARESKGLANKPMKKTPGWDWAPLRFQLFDTAAAFGPSLDLEIIAQGQAAALAQCCDDALDTQTASGAIFAAMLSGATCGSVGVLDYQERWCPHLVEQPH